MTIPEAAQLVLQAGAIGRERRVFVLDMGEPVRIVDLANQMIRLSGKEPGTDIEIEFTGLRPGEKLYEELWGKGERVVQTPQPKILRCTSHPVDVSWLDDELADLERRVVEGDAASVAAKLDAMLSVTALRRGSRARNGLGGFGGKRLSPRAAPGGARLCPRLRPYSRYERALRPCLAPPGTPRGRGLLRQTLLTAWGLTSGRTCRPFDAVKTAAGRAKAASRPQARKHEGVNGVTDIGVPDPLEPEIEIVPRVEPLPGPIEVPTPDYTSPSRHDPRRTAARLAHLASAARRGNRNSPSPCSSRASTATSGPALAGLLGRVPAARSSDRRLRLRRLRGDEPGGRARHRPLGAVGRSPPDRRRAGAALGDAFSRTRSATGRSLPTRTRSRFRRERESRSSRR